MTPEHGDVTVVIPHYNRADLLSTLLKHLSAQTYPIREIRVVDNGSTDGSAIVAEKAGAGVIRLGKNLGFATAVNHGIRDASTRWIAIMNNDVTFGPDWLATLLSHANSADAWFVTGKVLRADATNTIDGTWDAISRGGAPWRCGNGRPDGPLWSEARAIHFPPLTAAVFRTELFRRVGLLDEQFESYLEDLDLGLRCVAKQLSGWYVPQAVAWHVGSATLGAWRKATVSLLARNRILLWKKHFLGAPLWPAVVGNVLWILLAFRHGTGISCIRGALKGLILSPSGDNQPSWQRIYPVVVESERQIRELQERTGFDWYWKAYFAGVRN